MTCFCSACATPYERVTRMFVCPECGDKRCPRAYHHDNPCQGKREPTPPLGCEDGIMLNQNLMGLKVGFRVDHTLPPGTLEVWQDGKRVGRIVNIGSK